MVKRKSNTDLITSEYPFILSFIVGDDYVDQIKVAVVNIKLLDRVPFTKSWEKHNVNSPVLSKNDYVRFSIIGGEGKLICEVPQNDCVPGTKFNLWAPGTWFHPRIISTEGKKVRTIFEEIQQELPMKVYVLEESHSPQDGIRCVLYKFPADISVEEYLKKLTPQI